MQRLLLLQRLGYLIFTFIYWVARTIVNVSIELHLAQFIHWSSEKRVLLRERCLSDFWLSVTKMDCAKTVRARAIKLDPLMGFGVPTFSTRNGVTSCFRSPPNWVWVGAGVFSMSDCATTARPICEVLAVFDALQLVKFLLSAILTHLPWKWGWTVRPIF